MPKNPRPSQKSSSVQNKINGLIQESLKTVNGANILNVDSQNQTAEETTKLAEINKKITETTLIHKFTSNEIALIENLPQEHRELFLILVDENEKQQLMIQEFFKGFRHVGNAIEEGAQMVVDQVAKSEEEIKVTVTVSKYEIMQQAEEIGNGIKNDLHDLKIDLIASVDALKKEINENKVTTMGQMASVMYGILNCMKQGIIAIGMFFLWLHTIWWSWREPVTGIIPTALSSMIPCWIIITSMFWAFLEWVLITMLIIDGVIYGAINPVTGFNIDGVGEWLFQLPFIFGILILKRLWEIGHKIGWKNPIMQGIINKLSQFIAYIGGNVAKFPLFAKIIYIFNFIIDAIKTGYSNFTSKPDFTYWFNELLKLVTKKIYDNAPSLWGGKITASTMQLIEFPVYNNSATNKKSEQKMEQNENQKIKKEPVNNNIVTTIPRDIYSLAELKSMYETMHTAHTNLKKESKPTMDSKWMNKPITISPKMKEYLNMMLDIPVFIVKFVEYAENDVNKAIKKLNKSNHSRSRSSQSKRSKRHNSQNDVSKRRTQSSRNRSI